MQERIGKGGATFKLFKFATMLKDSPNIGTGTVTMKGDPRVLPIGKFLRSTNLNELPGLWSVLKGDMSLVYPRPLLVEYLPLYSTQQARRHEIKPGVTRLAKVNGRNAISSDEKFDLDVWYVDKQVRPGLNGKNV